MDPRFARHIAACNNAVLPGERLAFLIGADHVGWVKPALARALCEFDAAFTAAAAGERITLRQDAAADLPELALAMVERGFGRRRGEEFDVRATPDGPALARIDRGMLPSFGILATGVHVNGLVRRADGLHVWIARRSPHKALDPGKLDHIVAGGVCAGMDVRGTLLKEAAEEASLPAALAARAVETGQVGYAMERGEGLRRDRLHCFDLELPEDFVPRAGDDEVEAFEVWPIQKAFETVRDTDDFKFNVNLVLIDLFGRLGMLKTAKASGAI